MLCISRCSYLPFPTATRKLVSQNSIPSVIASSLFTAPLVCNSSPVNDDFSNPPRRPIGVAQNEAIVEKIQSAVPRDYRSIWNVLKYDSHKSIPSQTDVLIVGGGIIGWSAAYWLKTLGNVDVTVVERDPAYTRSSTVFGIGGIRQQFHEEEYIRMSLFGAEFMRNLRQHLSVLDEDPPDIQFHPHGYLLTASEAESGALAKSFQLQKSLGADVILMDKKAMKTRWPWLNVDDVTCATYGVSNEGWFDPWMLLFVLRKKAATLGAQFVHGEVVGFDATVQNSDDTTSVASLSASSNQPSSMLTLKNAEIRGVDKQIHKMRFAHVINAAGPWSGEVAKMAGIGVTGTILPVEPRLQHLFVVHPRWRSGSKFPPSFNKDTPWLVDFQGIQLKRESFGSDFITWFDPPPPMPPHNSTEISSEEKEPLLEVDYSWYEKRVWPLLAHRIPNMESAKIRVAWSGLTDYNTMDQHLVIGEHPGVSNLLLCSGTSGHGIQHALALGLALAEKVHWGRYKTIDLQRFAFQRFIKKSHAD